MYYFLGISLLLAFLLVFNIFISLATSFIWKIADKSTQNLSAQERSRIIFGLRVFPLLLTLIFVFVFLLPAYLLFESATENETVTLKLAIPAVLSIIGILIALYRVFGTWWQTRRLTNEWLKISEPIFVENFLLPVYQLKHSFPVIAVVGVFKPKLFIAEQIFSTLNEDELSAAIAHEVGHLETKDNFKRIVLRVCRDLLIFPMGKKIEQVWSQNSESAADEYAAHLDKKSSLNLASALIKIAKTIPQNTSPLMPLGSFLLEESNGDLTYRVQRLVQLAGEEKKAETNLRLAFQISSMVILVSIFVLATNYNFLFQVHNILEKFVAVLQ